MTPERWQQIKAVFAEAMVLDTAARAAYLDTACSGDADLRVEVESLLASSPPAGDHFLDAPAVFLQAASAPSPGEMSGRRVGPYELSEEIGHGGMGAVYRARRADGQYEQQVAIKLVRSGYEDRRALLQRFWTERQILATLDHPHIARLLDGGATEDGSPYLVMELIEGDNICDYCDAHRLNIAARLALFRQVCSAVQFAHQRLIVHRHQAVEHSRDAGRHAEAAGFRDSEDPGSDVRRRGDAQSPDDARLREPGANSRRTDHDGLRCVFARRRVVPVAVRTLAVPCRHQHAWRPL